MMLLLVKEFIRALAWRVFIMLSMLILMIKKCLWYLVHKHSLIELSIRQPQLLQFFILIEFSSF